MYGFGARVLDLQTVFYCSFHSSSRQREDEDGMKVSKTGCSTLGAVAYALR